MYKRYYDGYGRVNDHKDKGEIIIPEAVEASSNDSAVGEIALTESDTGVAGCRDSKRLFSLPCDIDDIILIGILLFLLFDKDKDGDKDDNDIFMLLIVGFVLFSDIL